MLLQASGRTNALRAMLEAEQKNSPDFLRLANTLSALYPIALEQVVAGNAPEDYKDPNKFLSRTCFTRALSGHLTMVVKFQQRYEKSDMGVWISTSAPRD
jgi:hypothetical protein